MKIKRQQFQINFLFEMKTDNYFNFTSLSSCVNSSLFILSLRDLMLRLELDINDETLADNQLGRSRANSVYRVVGLNPTSCNTSEIFFASSTLDLSSRLCKPCFRSTWVWSRLVIASRRLGSSVFKSCLRKVM